MSVLNQIINGNFQDIEGNPLANGILIFQLNVDCIVDTNTLICSGREITIPLDSSGNIPSSPEYQVYNNDQITPSDSFYIVKAYSATGELSWGPAAVQVLSTTSPWDCGVWIP